MGGDIRLAQSGLCRWLLHRIVTGSNERQLSDKRELFARMTDVCLDAAAANSADNQNWAGCVVDHVLPNRGLEEPGPDRSIV